MILQECKMEFVYTDADFQIYLKKYEKRKKKILKLKAKKEEGYLQVRLVNEKLQEKYGY